MVKSLRAKERLQFGRLSWRDKKSLSDYEWRIIQAEFYVPHLLNSSADFFFFAD
jgi:hypothetical protein